MRLNEERDKRRATRREKQALRQTERADDAKAERKRLVHEQERQREEYEDNPHLACGPYSIYCLLRYMELQDTKRKGSIKAYYDSLDTKYVKNKKRASDSKNFVSYVSIKFI